MHDIDHRIARSRKASPLMRADIGFILLTHTKPAQICRLLDRLNRMFDYPPIVVHHDFSQSDLDTGRFAPNISFVMPFVNTAWGSFSAVEASLKALRQLYRSNAGPDWFVLLSGSDYPIKSAAQIRGDLAASTVDAHIQYELIDPADFKRDWQQDCYRRYFQTNLDQPSPFSDTFRCYAGEFWFTANRRAAQYILDFHASRPALASYYSSVPSPDESYVHCILANAPGLTASGGQPGLTARRQHLRYIDWQHADSVHPATLGIADLPVMTASPAHFARKFDIDHDSAVLDALDRSIGIGSPP